MSEIIKIKELKKHSEDCYEIKTDCGKTLNCKRLYLDSILDTAENHFGLRPDVAGLTVRIESFDNASAIEIHVNDEWIMARAYQPIQEIDHVN